jgi:hypothetical protein
MKKTFVICAVIALIGLALPSPASAATFTFVCDPSTEPAPPDWFGGPWSAPVRLVVDTTARTVELLDTTNNRTLGDTQRPGRLSSLNDYKMDITVTESTISWGVIEMWGFSGYVDRRSGRLDVIWSNPAGYSPNTLSRQFHGICKER